MNRGSHYFPMGQIVKPVLVGFKTASDSQSIALPSSVRNGDTLILAVGQRNGTFTMPAGWGKIITEDASSGELNLVYIKTANNEPQFIPTVFGAGQQSVIIFAFRSSKALGVFGREWHIGSEQASALYGVKNGVFIGFAFDALSATHVTGFTGLTTIGRIATANAAVCAAYGPTIDTSLYGAYAATPTGASTDGYASLVIG